MTVTTTENGGSPIKSERIIQGNQLNPPFFLLPESKEDTEKRTNDTRMDNISEKNEESSNFDGTMVNHVQEMILTNSGDYTNKIKIMKETLDEINNTNNDSNSIHTIAIPNFQFSGVEITQKQSTSNDKTNQQIINSSNSIIHEQNLQVPKRFLKNLEHCSEHFLTPPSPKYETSEISEEFVSSRSDSPAEKREKKNSIFRRESRFRSMKNRGFESGKMTAKDKKLLKMILVIFLSFLICYLPITITKTFKDEIDWRGLNIAGYILIYLTTCINPIIYVVMSSEYRSAYKNVLLCRSDSMVEGKKRVK